MDAYMRSLAQQRQVFRNRNRRTRAVPLEEASGIDNKQDERATTDAALREQDPDITKLNAADVGIADQEWKKYTWLMVAAAGLGIYLLIKSKLLRAGASPQDLPL